MVTTTKLMQRLENEKERAEMEVRSTREKLVREMRNLADHLMRRASDLHTDPTYRVNGLGVIQSSGTSIDVLCGKLNEAEERVQSIRRILAAAIQEV